MGGLKEHFWDALFTNYMNIYNALHSRANEREKE